MAEPTIIFVPGFWEGPTIFAPVISKIESEYGYHTSTVTLPSTGSLPPNIKTFADDVRAIQRAIENHVEESRDVIVIAHSAGGFLSSEAVKGLSVKDRSSLKKRGGVRKMIFLTGMLIPEGTKHQNDQPFFDIQGDKMFCSTPLEKLLGDVPPAATEKAIANFSWQPSHTWGDDVEITYCGWRDIPSVYLICENDVLAPLPMQQLVAKTTGGKMETCSAGHMVTLSQPDLVAGLIRKEAQG